MDSWLSDLPVKATQPDGYFYRIIWDVMGPWGVSEGECFNGFETGKDLKIGGQHLGLNRTEQVRNYLVSIVAVHRKLQMKPPILMSTEDLKLLSGSVKEHYESKFHFIDPADILSYIEKVPFNDKALEVLKRISLLEDNPFEPLNFEIFLEARPASLAPATEGTKVDYRKIIPGLTDHEGGEALRYLCDEGYLYPNKKHNGTVSLVITPSGRHKADALTNFSESEPRAFMICRFNKKLDKLFPVFHKIAAENVKIDLNRVKDVYHVERIDDRIVFEINSSALVVVDLTDQNFNVAFESGYALALGKPIVWLIEDDGTDFHPPFDIQSQNIFRYKPGEEHLEANIIDLEYRLLAAWDKANSSF